MNAPKSSGSQWAHDELCSANLPDRRHVVRAVKMLTRMAERPAGRVLDVFETSAERQGAYDLLANSAVSEEPLCRSIGEATVLRAADDAMMFVAVDGTSLKLTDRQRAKDFGAIGSHRAGARGLKVINGYGVSSQGIPLGITSQVWWSRKPSKRRQDHQSRRLEGKETRHWVEAIERTCALVRHLAVSTRLCFLLDREGDGVHTLSTLVSCGHDFIVRSAHNRRLATPGKQRAYLRNVLARVPAGGEFRLSVPAGPRRTARSARMVTRYHEVNLLLRDHATGKRTTAKITAISARETGTRPRGEQPLHWMLLTNRPVQSFEDACVVVYGYAQRWRLEDFHRTWKSGDCNVEECQLRRAAHVKKWATLMAATAARIERMKMLARTEPNLPASIELTPYEIQALVLNRRRTKKRTDPTPTDNPTIGEAVRWLADIGGYTGKSSGGPPGSITIARGFERIIPAALLLKQLEREGRLR